METAKDLVQSCDYVVMTFSTTTRALKAEQVLKSNKAVFLTIPTPREISASCGISVKMHTHNRTAYEKLFSQSNVEISGIYHITGTGRNTQLSVLTPEYQQPACH